jgi:hypothetical protein
LVLIPTWCKAGRDFYGRIVGELHLLLQVKFITYFQIAKYGRNRTQLKKKLFNLMIFYFQAAITSDCTSATSNGKRLTNNELEEIWKEAAVV